MKDVEAITKPFKMEEVKGALATVGVEGMTVSQVKGFGHQKGHAEMCWGNECAVDFLPKAKVEIVLPEYFVAGAVEALVRAGKIGDGKNFVSPVENAIRIRTEKTGEKAV